MEKRIGLENNSLAENANHLLTLTRGYFVAQTKVLAFHWNVEGPHFVELHDFFEDTYKELQESLDEIAERIRALGQYAPAGVQALSTNSFINDTAQVQKAAEMLAILKQDYEIIIQNIRQILVALQESTDEGTKDLLVEHLRNFEKRLWMIEALTK